MTKFTIVTDSGGRFVGAVQGHELYVKQNGIAAQVSFPNGHQLHKVEVEDDLTKVTDPAVFQERMSKHLPKR
jgi:hypothetical protein